MKEIKNLKLGFNKNAEITVLADVYMKSESDIDSLFLCFFTILTDPLRLSVLTSGCLNEQLASILGQKEETIREMMESNPQLYATLIQQNSERMLSNGVEQNKIELNSESNSANASGILSSLLKHKHYVQKTRYHFPDGTIQKQDQTVDVSTLMQPFKVMLEICKRWDDPTLMDELQ
jgi:hypothetical protein|tara:strand:+ start:142 stop:672 length:531 start_codon:yes stop_codon:yes gene_type:complete